MVYKVIGLMSGSSLDGIDIAFVEFQEKGGTWNFEIVHSSCKEYDKEWLSKLKHAIELPAMDNQLLHTEYGKFLGEKLN
jgi:anhydro-N-acetylmuramic acid kinase